jgi:hypothetical protein
MQLLASTTPCHSMAFYRILTTFYILHVPPALARPVCARMQRWKCPVGAADCWLRTPCAATRSVCSWCVPRCGVDGPRPDTTPPQTPTRRDLWHRVSKVHVPPPCSPVLRPAPQSHSSPPESRAGCPLPATGCSPTTLACLSRHILHLPPSNNAFLSSSLSSGGDAPFQDRETAGSVIVAGSSWPERGKGRHSPRVGLAGPFPAPLDNRQNEVELPTACPEPFRQASRAVLSRDSPQGRGRS